MTVAAKLRSAIVLAPGLLGFDELRFGGRTLARYFPEIPELLIAAGNRVLVARVFPTIGIAERAKQLKAFIDRHLPGEAFHLIGHSMGGLDCRYLISRLGMADRVRSLTSVGTPHRGTTLADWGIRRLKHLVRPLLECLGVPYQAFYDLTTEKCRQFNEQVPDARQVRYFSVAGKTQVSWHNPLWRLSQRIVTEAEGPNDGLVSIASATWGEQVEVWDCDHFGLVNWPDWILKVCGLWHDRSSEYAALTRRLQTAEA